MSTYRQRLQEALLRVSWIANRKPRSAKCFYAILETLAYVSFTAAWLVAIVTHL